MEGEMQAKILSVHLTGCSVVLYNAGTVCCGGFLGNDEAAKASKRET